MFVEPGFSVKTSKQAGNEGPVGAGAIKVCWLNWCLLYKVVCVLVLFHLRCLLPLVSNPLNSFLDATLCIPVIPLCSSLPSTDRLYLIKAGLNKSSILLIIQDVSVALLYRIILCKQYSVLMWILCVSSFGLFRQDYGGPEGSKLAKRQNTSKLRKSLKFEDTGEVYGKRKETRTNRET